MAVRLLGRLGRSKPLPPSSGAGLVAGGARHEVACAFPQCSADGAATASGDCTSDISGASVGESVRTLPCEAVARMRRLDIVRIRWGTRRAMLVHLYMRECRSLIGASAIIRHVSASLSRAGTAVGDQAVARARRSTCRYSRSRSGCGVAE